MLMMTANCGDISDTKIEVLFECLKRENIDIEYLNTYCGGDNCGVH
jgi:hypothetical protein